MKLTSRTYSPSGFTTNKTLFHVVDTNNPTQDPDGSSYKSTIDFAVSGSPFVAIICGSGVNSALKKGGSNTSSGDYSAVLGGYNNTSSCYFSTIAGGCSNISSGFGSTVSGGRNNISSGCTSTIGGGCGNTASGINSTVAGGCGNTSSCVNSTVGGGSNNDSSGTNSTIGGGCCNITNAIHSIISGGHRNVIQSPTDENFSQGVTIGGGIGHNTSGGTLNTITGDLTGTIDCCDAGRFSTISGGLRNCATGNCSTVGGGYNNTSCGLSSTVGGGGDNTSCGFFSSIGGGQSNIALGGRSTVGGGASNTASCKCSTIGGGFNNTSSGILSTIGGGRGNTSSGNLSTIGGGYSNSVSGSTSFVGGGRNNSASGYYSTIGGGINNTSENYSFVGGGSNNHAYDDGDTGSVVVGGTSNKSGGPNGSDSFVGGGGNNTASGLNSTVVGGRRNTASGDFSFVGGGGGVLNCNIASGNCSGVLGGKNNDTCGYNNSFIIGSDLCATAECWTFMNNTCVQGDVCANCFFGDGSGLTNLPISSTSGTGGTTEILSGSGTRISGGGTTESPYTADTIYNTILNPDLTMDTDVGGVVSGTKVGDLTGKTLVQLFDTLLFPTTLPTYKQPTIQLQGLNSQTIEIGNTINIDINAESKKNDAGNYTTLKIRKQDYNENNLSVILTDNTLTTTSTSNVPNQFGFANPNNPNISFRSNNYTETIVIPQPINNNTNIKIVFDAQGEYEEGLPIKDNKGDDTTTSPIGAGSHNSTNRVVTGIYPYFWGFKDPNNGDLTVDDVLDAISGGTSEKVLESANLTMSINYNVEGKWIWFAHFSEYNKKTNWFVTQANQGTIGPGNLFNDPIKKSVNGPTSNNYWSGVNFEVYLSSFPTTLTDTIKVN